MNQIPHRLDVVGFFDQVYLNKHHPGSTIICSMEPMELEERSGMASSTRETIKTLYGHCLPSGLTEEEMAQTIFEHENPLGCKYISGTVDALGLVSKGITRYYYDNSYWPRDSQRILDIELLEWFENVVSIKQTKPRPTGYEVLSRDDDYPIKKIRRLSLASEATWRAIKRMDAAELGACVNETFDSCYSLIPGYVSDQVRPIIDSIRNDHLGVKLMGAGGFGYMMIVSEKIVEGVLNLKVRKEAS